jgi:predicted helicase
LINILLRNLYTRKVIKKRFEKGNDLQALVAIKCLDEGVDIPSIKRAFILASSTNPREYIQRRGRVLRLSEGKPYAEIFDFITIPTPMDGRGIDPDILKSIKTLIFNELRRIESFKSICLNPINADKIINDVMEYYRLNELDLKEYQEIIDIGEI